MDLWREYSDFDYKEFSTSKKGIEHLTLRLFNDERVKDQVVASQKPFMGLPSSNFKRVLGYDVQGMYVGVSSSIGLMKSRDPTVVVGLVYQSLAMVDEGSYHFYKRVIDSLYDLSNQEQLVKKTV